MELYRKDLALLLASILSINSAPAAAIFMAIQNTRTQQQVLRAAAETVLNIADFELFSALLNLAAQFEKDRNALAHGLFGGSMILKDGLFWTEPKDFVNLSVAAKSSEQSPVIDTDAIRSKTFIYEAADLETIAEKLQWLYTHIGFLTGYLSITDPSLRAVRYRQLCDEPLLSQELSRMRADQRKTQEPLQRQDRRGRKKRL